MLEQSDKPRILKIKQQKETSPAINEPMLITQYTAIIQGINFIKEQLDFLISQPQNSKPKAETGGEPEHKLEKATAIWEQTERERLQQNSERLQQKKEKQVKKKSSGRKVYLVLVILVILALVGVYLWYSYSHGYVFFWQKQG
ncbi:hypothetical protein MUP46_01080 [Patescibacteria group bacterium]|nr:hypothetical protein [Patescibacteria group bacterium]